MLIQHLFQLGDACPYLVGLALEEVFAVFGITEAVAAGNVGGIVLHVHLQLFVIEQQLPLLLNFFDYLFPRHNLRVEY